MIYNVFGGTLNLALSIYLSISTGRDANWKSEEGKINIRKYSLDVFYVEYRYILFTQSVSCAKHMSLSIN